MTWRVGSFLLLLATLVTVANSLEITSVLNLYEKYLLFFTADGFVVSQEADWCTAGVCPNLTSASDSKGQTKENVTEISDLWNHSRVVGLSRVDVSARYHNPFTHMQFILLIQKDITGLSYLIVNPATRRLASFGDGAGLFGSAWKNMSCLHRIVDIIADYNDHLTSYIICRRTVDDNSPLEVIRAALDLNNFAYHMLRPINPSQKVIAELPLYILHLLPAYRRRLKDLGPITSLEMWNEKLLVLHQHRFVIVRNYKVIWSSPVEDLIDTVFLVHSDEKDMLATTVTPSHLSGDRAFQLLQVGIILFTFQFLLGLFFLFWRGTLYLADYLFEGVKSTEPVWLSQFEIAALKLPN